MSRVSVIVPVYNGENYIASAIQSVLAQTYADWELIAVNDGSTDNSQNILTSFESEPRVRVINQKNRGLAAARNAGIAVASGEFVGLLDGDDEWRPRFLEEMLALAAANSSRAVFYCCAQCMDSTGEDLPQLAGAKSVKPAEMYRTLLDANFIIPSTVMMKRDVLLNAGGFDQTQPAMNGCEDWDLWLRLSPTCDFIGTTQCLARYRIHAGSMSTDLRAMQRAKRTVVEKHFGPEDSESESWSVEKRQAYGGLYRNSALAALTRQGDWAASQTFLAKALISNPLLASNLDLFYELALGEQPLGQRGTASQLTLERNAGRLAAMLEAIFEPSANPKLLKLRSCAFGTAYFALSLVAYNSSQANLGRRYVWAAARYLPSLWQDSRFVGIFIRMFINRKLLAGLKLAANAWRRTSLGLA